MDTHTNTYTESQEASQWSTLGELIQTDPLTNTDIHTDTDTHTDTHTGIQFTCTSSNPLMTLILITNFNTKNSFKDVYLGTASRGALWSAVQGSFLGAPRNTYQSTL